MQASCYLSLIRLQRKCKLRGSYGDGSGRDLRNLLIVTSVIALGLGISLYLYYTFVMQSKKKLWGFTCFLHQMSHLRQRLACLLLWMFILIYLYFPICNLLAMCKLRKAMKQNFTLLLVFPLQSIGCSLQDTNKKQGLLAMYGSA